MPRANYSPQPGPNRTRRERAKTLPRAIHAVHRAGTKLLKRFYRAKHGVRPASARETREWYATYLSAVDAAVRARDAEKRALRAQRKERRG